MALMGVKAKSRHQLEAGTDRPWGRDVSPWADPRVPSSISAGP